MAPPRKSKAQAALSGALYKNPQRYRERSEPLITAPLGDPSAWLKPEAAEAWEDFRVRMPWLNKSHRGITELASILQSRMAAGVLGVPGMNLLRLVLGQMGATPAASRFAVEAVVESEDPADQYFT